MPSLRHSSFLVVGVFDKQVHQLSTSKMMKISKAPGILKNAVTMFKIKAEVLHTKLLMLATLRRRMALLGAVSRRIHAFVSSSGRENKQARVELEYGEKAFVLSRAVEPTAAADHERDGIIDLSEVVMFDEDDHGSPDWTHSLFEDDNYCYNDDEDAHDGRYDYGAHDALDEPSVIDIIRSNREVQGLEFNVDEEIDEACDMFIRKFRKQMNRSF